MSTSVLIVNFRGYDDLNRCLDSLEPHLGASDEVIVVDNDSDEEQLRWIVTHHPRVRAIPSAVNLGFAAGVNLAARHASASFLLFLNPDTIIEGPVLSVMEEWLLGNCAAGVVGPRVCNADGTIQPSARRFPGMSTFFGGRSTWLTKRHPNNPWSRRNLLGLDSDDALDVDWLAGSCLMTRRDVFERVGGLDETFFLYWEDADYCRRVVTAGSRCTYLPKVAVRHMGGGSARYVLPQAIRAFHESAYRLFRKHAGPAGRVAGPLVHTGLRLRGEMRLRRALRDQRATTPEVRESLLVDHLSSASRVRAEKQSA